MKPTSWSNSVNRRITKERNLILCQPRCLGFEAILHFHSLLMSRALCPSSFKCSSIRPLIIWLASSQQLARIESGRFRPSCGQLVFPCSASCAHHVQGRHHVADLENYSASLQQDLCCLQQLSDLSSVGGLETFRRSNPGLISPRWA